MQEIYGSKLSLYKFYRTSARTVYSPNMPNAPLNSVPVFQYTAKDFKFYLKRPGEHQYTEIPSGSNAFKKLMSLYLKDDASLVANISQRRLRYENIDDMVLQYNTDK